MEPDSLRRPGLAIVLLVAVAALCTGLGAWQYGRAGQARALAERIAAAAEQPPIPLRTREGAGDDLRYRSIEIAGQYAGERQFLLDHAVLGGVVGYYVLTPFVPSDGGPWLIVNRGWVRADPDRRVLPDVGVDTGRRRVTGVLDTLPAPGLRLGGRPELEIGAPLAVLSFPSIGELEQMLRQRLFGYQLLLDAQQPEGYARDFPGAALEPERHVAYAAQWWLFASIAAGAAGMIGWRLLRRRVE
jgi:surfeit locus 1 family protein